MRPFRILGLQQVALGNLDKTLLEHLFIDVLGCTRTGEYRSESENVDETILHIGHRIHGVEIDLMMPLDPNSKPKVHEPALNHIGLWVDDLHRAVTYLQEQGLRFTPGGIRKGAAGHDVCFIHPKGNDSHPIGGAGVLIELVQAPPELVAEFEDQEPST